MLVLAYDYREVKNFVARNPSTNIDRIFLWQGNARVLIAMVKYIEDKRKRLHDTKAVGVPVLLVVEDNIRYYSSVLPVIYTELISQSKRVIREGINLAHKLVRQRARPKILLVLELRRGGRVRTAVSRQPAGRRVRCTVSARRSCDAGCRVPTVPLCP